MPEHDFIIGNDEPVLVTGSNGFIGSKVVENLLRYGFKNLRCFVRPSSNLEALNKIAKTFESARIDIVKGNLLSPDDCRKAAEGVSVIYHLAMQREKTFPGCFLNTVVTTRNLLDSVVQAACVKRFLNVSSFAVYSNWNLKRGALLDETCEIETHLVERHESYTYAKGKQDELLLEYVRKYQIPFVIVRPGAVYGPGQREITGRVGIDSFGFFLHLGGPNQIPLSYVDNCAEAIMLAGIRKGVDGEVFNIVDDDLPTSRQFLKMYKKHVGHFGSFYIPYRIFYAICYLWEKYARWSENQLPPVFNRRRCATYWKGNRYSNRKLKDLLGWRPRIRFPDAARAYFEYAKETARPS